jgi:hypothetical protein
MYSGTWVGSTVLLSSVGVVAFSGQGGHETGPVVLVGIPSNRGVKYPTPTPAEKTNPMRMAPMAMNKHVRSGLDSITSPIIYLTTFNYFEFYPSQG